MTPETSSTQSIEHPKTTPETQLSPEQKKEQEILSMLENKYWVDLKLYIEEQSKVWISILKMDIENPNQTQIEKKAKEIYEAYLKSEIEKPEWVEKTVNIENIVENTWNDKIDKLKKEFDKVLNPILDKYDFLDNQTKNFVKLWISNSLFKWTIWEISDSLIWSFSSFVNSLWEMDENGIKNLANLALENPNESWRSLWLENLFKQKMWDLSKKLEQINDILNKVEPKLNQTEKQNIISHSDWFRSPSAIEMWVENLKVSDIDPSKTSKNEIPLDTEKLTEYMLKSRENIISLSKKLDLWVGIWDKLYAISSNPVLWKFSDKIMETILKLPVIWKLIAILLWLDPENAIWEYKENTRNFKLLSSLKSLWKRKDNWKDVVWKAPFEQMDLSQLSFDKNKNNLKILSSTLWEIKDDKDNNFWQKAFSEQWYDTGNGKPKFILKLNNHWSDGKITDDEFKKIIDEWVKKYKEEVDKSKATQTENAPWTQSTSTEQSQTRPSENPTATQSPESNETVDQNTKDNALRLLKGETIEWLSNTLWFWDYNDFKKIKIEDIKSKNDIDLILKKAIWEGSNIDGNEIEKSDYEELSKDVKDSLKYAIKIIKNFLSENKNFSTYEEWEWWWWKDLLINDIIKIKEFKNYLLKK